MSDFSLWLYAYYIRPQLNAVEKDEYEFDFDLLERELVPASHVNLERVLAFTAIQAFLLGFRTSEGLTPLPPRAHCAASIIGAPAGAQRSGSGEERRSKGRLPLSRGDVAAGGRGDRDVNAVLAARRGRS